MYADNRDSLVQVEVAVDIVEVATTDVTSQQTLPDIRRMFEGGRPLEVTENVVMCV